MKSKKIRWVAHVAPVGKKANACGILVQKTERKIHLRILRSRRVGNLKQILGEIG
jgi:hypothetical protein